jgi:hypothetical protein
MKKIISAFIFASTLSLPLVAGINWVGTRIFEKAQTYGKETQIGLEVYNKGKSDIWVAVKNGDDFSNGAKNVSGNFGGTSSAYMAQFPLDISKESRLAVWLKNPGTVTVDKKFLVAGAPQWSPAPDFIYTFPKNKTIYISWDKDNFPRPQTGVLGGITGKTDSGLALSKSKNVTKDDIKKIYSK